MMNKNQIKAYYNEFIDQTTGAYNIGGLLEALFGENGAQIFDNNPDANSIVMQVNNAYNGEDMLDWLVKGIIALTTYVTGTTDKSKMTINDTKTELSKRLMVRQADTLYKGDNYSANQPILDLFNIGYIPYQGSKMTWPDEFSQSDNYPAMLLSIPQETQYEEGGTEITVGRKQVLFSLRPYLQVWIRQWTGDTRGNWSLLTTDEHMLDAISQQLTPVGENVETLKDLVHTFFQGGNLLWKFCTPYNGNFGGLEIRLKDRNIVHIDGDKSGSGGLSVLLYEDDLPGWLVPETEYVATAMLSYGDATGIKLEIEFCEDDTFINRKIALVGQNGNFTVPANANKIKVSISVTGELGAHIHCGIIFGLFASPHFAGDVYAGGKKLATEDYVDSLTDALDERADELEEKTTTLESQTAALETETSILTNADGDAKFTGDVFAKGRKLATEKYADEANAKYVGLLTGDDLIAKYCSHEKREINGVTFQWTNGTTLDLHRASGTAAAEYTLYSGEIPWWLAAGKKYDVNCSVERHGGTSVPLELSFSFRSGDRITVTNFFGVGGTMTVPSDADSVEITVDVAAGGPEDIHATLTLGLFPDVVFNGDLTVGGTIIADGSRLASQEYADEKAADAEDNAKAYADGILAPVDASVTAIKNKTDLFTTDGNAAKFAGDVYANGEKLATAASVAAVSGEVDALDGRTDTLETTTTTLGNRATALESRATALETTTTTLATKTSILKNSDGDAVFDGDVYATVDDVAKKLATEERVGALTADKLAIVYLNAGDELPTGDDIAEKTVYCLPNTKGGHDKYIYLPVTGKDEDECWEQLGGGGSTAIVIDDGIIPPTGEEGVDYYIKDGDSYVHKIYRDDTWYNVGQDQSLAERVQSVENNVQTHDSRLSTVEGKVRTLESHDTGRVEGLVYEDSILSLVDGAGNPVGESVTITDGGGGGTSVAYSVKIVAANTLGTTFDVTPATKDTDSIVSYYWYATQNGVPYTPANATVRIEVNGTVVKTINNASPAEDPENIQDSDKFTENVASYLRNGENAVRVRISFESEEERTIQQQKTWYITLWRTDLSWSLNGRDIAYYSAPQQSMTFYVQSIAHSTLHYQFVNGQGETVSSATINDADGTVARVIDIPAGETTLSAWLSYTLRGTTYATTPISAVMVRGVAETTLSVLDTDIEANQYDTLAIRWMASGPDTSYSVEKRVNGTLISTESVERTMQIWRYKCRETGTFTLTLKCGSVVKNITLVVSAVEGLTPVTSGLIMDVDPAGHSNSEANKDQFGYVDGTGTNHPFSFSSNFDWVNGGFQTDPDTSATVFVIRRGTSVTFDRGLFRSDDHTAATGKCILMQYQVKDCVDYDAQIGRSYYENDHLGLRLNAHDAAFEGGGRNVKVNYCEESLIEIGLNIDVTKTRELPNNARSGIYKFWMGGTPANSAPFTVGEAFAPASDTNLYTLGSDDCDIWLYRFKMYNRGLSDGEMLQNFIVDCPDKEELSERYNRNKIFVNDNALEGTISVEKLTAACPDLYIIEISASEFPQGKGGKNAKPCSITCTKGGVKQFEAPNAKYTLQGTSSMNYIAAAGNLDIDISTDRPRGYAMTNNSIPVSYFNLKANVASSENANNVCAADLFNTYYPIKSLAQVEDSRVRNTVEGHPCAVFIHNSGSEAMTLGTANDSGGTSHSGRVLEADQTILYFAGDMNNSKKNVDVFGESDIEDGEGNPLFCVEFLSNGQTRSRFKASDFTNECWNEESEPIAPKGNHFEIRYAPDGKDDAAKAKFAEMQHWVWTTDCYPDTTNGIGYPFSQDDLSGTTYPDTDEGHRAYRRAKFTSELEQYFDVDGLAFYYVFTEFFLAMDQREKNQFCSYEPDRNGNWKFNFSKFYDADTILGIDNLGNMSLTYGLEDHPTTENTGKLSDEWVYDTGKGLGQEPVLWANLRECFPDKIKEWYRALDGTLFSASRLITKFRDYQKIRPEALMIESYNGVYDDPYIRAGETTYLESMFYGQKAEQREQFLRYQQIYMSSKYSSNTATNNQLQIRSNPSQAAADFRKELTFIPYSDMYCCVGRDSNNIWDKKRVSKGESVTLTDLADVDNTVRDNVFVNVYSINNIKHVSTAAYLYPARYTVGNAAKLQDMLLGAGDNYANPNALSVSPETVPLAEEIDLRGQFLVGNTVALDLSNNKWLKRLYIQNSGVTGVTLADGCPLTEARLGRMVSRIQAKNLNRVTAFTFENNDYSALRSLLVENSVGFPLEDILDNAFSLTNIRLTGVNLHWADASTLMRIATADIHGITADGVDDGTSGPIITGTVTFTNISDADKDRLQDKFPELEIIGGGGSALHIVTFYNETEVFAKEYVLHGGNATDPRNAGYGIPTKAADAQYTYAFTGWLGNLTNITKDVDIYADYVDTVRTYRVTFFNGSDEIYHVDAEYGEDVQYSDAMAVAAGKTPYPQRDNSLCTGFIANGGTIPNDTFTVHGKIDAVAQFSAVNPPSQYKSLNECSWAEIKAIVEQGSLADNGKWVANGIEWFSTTYPSAATTGNAKAVTINYTIYEDKAGTTGKKWSPYRDYYRGDADYIVTDKSDTILFFPCATNHDYKVTGEIVNGDDASVLTDWHRFTSSTDQDTIDAAILSYRGQARRTNSVTFLASQTLDFKTMFQSNTSNRVSWPNSLVRKILTGSGGNTTSVEYEQTVWNCLPFDLRAAITPVLKFSNSGPNTTTSSNDLHVDYVSIDRLFLPARGELISPTMNATTKENWYKETYEGENDKGLYDCFTVEKNRAAKDTNNVPVTYWLRTRGVNNSIANAVADVEAVSGKVYSTNGVSANASFSVLFGFCI